MCVGDVLIQNNDIIFTKNVEKKNIRNFGKIVVIVSNS